MSDLDGVAERWKALRVREQKARDAVRRAVIAEKAELGTSDRNLAMRAGVDRMTVLEWLGKRRRAPRKPAGGVGGSEASAGRGPVYEPFVEAP